MRSHLLTSVTSVTAAAVGVGRHVVIAVAAARARLAIAVVHHTDAILPGVGR